MIQQSFACRLKQPICFLRVLCALEHDPQAYDIGQRKPHVRDR